MIDGIMRPTSISVNWREIATAAMHSFQLGFGSSRKRSCPRHSSMRIFKEASLIAAYETVGLGADKGTIEKDWI
jgi:hypothetical protein